MNKETKNNSLDYYFDDINGCKGLSQAEIDQRIGTISTLDKITDADQIAHIRASIVESNLKLVIKFAKDYQNVGVPLADLIQEGNIGLMRAVEKYDPAQAFKFTTYAVYWIKQGFLKVIKHNNKLIRTPTYVQEALSRIAKTRQLYEKEMGVEPTLEYLASSEGMTEEELEVLYNVSLDPVSLEAVYYGGDAAKNLKDFIPDPDVDLDRDIDQSRLIENIRSAIDTHLTPAEREVMILRYGLFNETVHTLVECADKMNKSREHVRQLESSSKDKLRELAPYLDDYRE